MIDYDCTDRRIIYLECFRSYCINHRPKQKIDEQVLKQAAAVDVMCYICYDKVNTNDFVKTLWAPCCKKDAWFHRICVQVNLIYYKELNLIDVR